MNKYDQIDKNFHQAFVILLNGVGKTYGDMRYEVNYLSFVVLLQHKYM